MDNIGAFLRRIANAAGNDALQFISSSESAESVFDAVDYVILIKEFLTQNKDMVTAEDLKKEFHPDVAQEISEILK